jgi:ubiquinone biosynthesis protein UbiJ
MPFELFLSAALSSVEIILNKALNLDPFSRNRLASLQGKVFAIKCTKPDCKIFIMVLENGFQLTNSIIDEADAEIAATADVLLKLLIAKNKDSIIRNENIQLKGDASSIQDLQAILFDLDIDWEYQLSKLIGDIPTQALSDGIAKLKIFLSNNAASFTEDIDEYLHEEKKIVPTMSELEIFYQRIDQLRLKVDRAESRINKLIRNYQ